MKWPDLAAKSRRSTAESLTTITLALTGSHRTCPGPAVLRRALFGYAFNPGRASQAVPGEINPGPGLDRESVPASGRAGRTRYSTRRPECLREAAGRQARLRDHHPPQAGRIRQRARLRRRTPAAARQPPRPDPVESRRRRRDRRPPLRRQPRPGRTAAGRRPGAGLARAAHGSVLRLPVLRRPASRRGRRAPRTRLRPADGRVGPDRPGRLHSLRRDRLDRRRRQPRGT